MPLPTFLQNVTWKDPLRVLIPFAWGVTYTKRYNSKQVVSLAAVGSYGAVKHVGPALFGAASALVSFILVYDIWSISCPL